MRSRSRRSSRPSPEQTTDIKVLQDRVRNFAQHQLESLRDFEVETEPGVFLGQKNIPVSRAGA
jgi:sulfopropanediol 3-dehydrogenase